MAMMRSLPSMPWAFLARRPTSAAPGPPEFFGARARAARGCEVQRLYCVSLSTREVQLVQFWPSLVLFHVSFVDLMGILWGGPSGRSPVRGTARLRYLFWAPLESERNLHTMFTCGLSDLPQGPRWKPRELSMLGPLFRSWLWPMA